MVKIMAIKVAEIKALTSFWLHLITCNGAEMDVSGRDVTYFKLNNRPKKGNSDFGI